MFYGRPVRGLERRFVETDDIMPSSDIKEAFVESPQHVCLFVCLTDLTVKKHTKYISLGFWFK